MNNKSKRVLFRSNLFIIIPGIFLFASLVGFLIFGLMEPSSLGVNEIQGYTKMQQASEERFLNDYSLGEFTVTNPFFVLDPYDIAPLSGMLMFETETAIQYKIVINGKQDEGDIEFFTKSETSHVISIFGLYPHRTNRIDIIAFVDGVEGDIIHTVEVTTLQLPSNIVLPTAIETTSEYFGDDLMLMMPALGSLPVAYDYAGDVRWYLSRDLSWAPIVLENGHLLLGSDRIIGDPYYTTGLYEIDFLGKVYRDYKIPGGYHHDVFEMENGNFLVASSDFEGTVEDVVVEVERDTGAIVNTWDVADYINVLDGVSEMWTSFDWFHNNSVDYDKTTDSIILSGRHQDAVISIGYTSKELNYIIGDPDNWDALVVNEYFFTPIGENFEWQYAQHSAIVLENGNIFIFDNGNNKSKDSETYVDAANSYSRGVIYDINTTDMTIEQVYEFGKDLGSDFYSPYISNVEYYNDKHYMIHSGGHGDVGEVPINVPGPLTDDPSAVVYKSMTYEVDNGIVKYYLELPDNFYRAKRINLYDVQPDFIFGRGLVVGELAQTETYPIDIDVKFSFLDTVPPKYEIDLLKEGDRFKVSGKFDRNDEIYLILGNETNELSYKIPTSRTPYTALCIDVFAGDERYIDFYVNDTLMDGDYQVYLVINGRRYNTYQHVDFN